MKRALIAAALLLAACPGGDEPGVDAGTTSRRDAGRPDVGELEWPDSGLPEDRDAGTEPDAGRQPEVAWCKLQSPAAAGMKLGGSVAVFGQVLVPGVTQGAGQGAGVVGQLGFGPAGSDPRSADGWVWGAASFNVDVGDNDEYMGRLAPQVAGRYAYAYRFRAGTSEEVYCDTDGGEFSPELTGVLDVKPAGVDWCNLQFPPSATLSSGGTLSAFGLVFLEGITDQAGQGAEIEGQLGYGPAGTNGSTSQDWSWDAAATFNKDEGNNDEYLGELTPAVGSYAYAFRFRHRGGPWTYCDQDGNDGSEGGYSQAQQGSLTVVAVKPPAIDWCNVQFPPSATIPVGGTLAVFGQAFVAGVTEPAGAGAGVIGEIGFGPAGSDGSAGQGWTWTAATYNKDEANNDEYGGSISPSAVGEYAYAVRFKYQSGDWRYCDLDGATGSTDFSVAQQGALSVAAVKPPTVDWCRMQIVPGSESVTSGDTFTSFGQVLVAGVTDPPGAGAQVQGELGVGPAGSDPSAAGVTGWNWTAATYNLDVGNNDEFTASLTPATGSWAYAWRFRYKTGEWLYCDSDGTDGSAGSFDASLIGSLTVSEPPQEGIDYCVLQWPPAGSITSGTSLTVYAQVYKAGVTEPAQADPLVEVQAGVGPSATDGSAGLSTWSWQAARFNLQASNNDEYMADLALAAGSYAYACRARYDGGAWRYCDLDGSDNGFAPGQQGSLTVSAATGAWAELRPINGYENVGAQLHVSAELYKQGLTDSAGQGAGVVASVGVGPAGSAPTGNDWTWSAAAYEGDAAGGGAQYNDVYGGFLVAPALSAAGYDVAVRFEAAGETLYADLDGDTAYASAEAGKLLTFAEPEVGANDVGWCKLQWPEAMSASGDVYGVVYVAGVSDHAGSDGRIGAMLGWGPDGTDPRTAAWTWVPAHWNVDAANDYGQLTNDEFAATLAAPSTPGTYRYAYRFRLSNGWTYCDKNGSSGRAEFDPAATGTLTIP